MIESGRKNYSICIVSIKCSDCSVIFSSALSWICTLNTNFKYILPHLYRCLYKYLHFYVLLKHIFVLMAELITCVLKHNSSSVLKEFSLDLVVIHSFVVKITNSCTNSGNKTVKLL